jgi:competence protein ComEA
VPGNNQPDQAGGQVDQRLARLLESWPRHAGAETEQHGSVHDEVDDWRLESSVGRPEIRLTAGSGEPVAPGLSARIRERLAGGLVFGRSQLVVVLAILVLGFGLAGWSVLRARPVALAPRPTASPSGAARTTMPPASATPSGPAPTAAPEPEPSGSATPMLEVHVLGAVRHPGVVTLPPGARVQDALDKAGGTKKSAELGDLNLAQPLADGQQIFIARHDGHSEVRDPVSVPPGNTAGDGSSMPPSGSPGSSGPPGQIVNLNTATVDQLDQLPGVGPVTAQKIIDWRTSHGGFTATAELQEVDGIGPKTYADLASLVTV